MYVYDPCLLRLLELASSDKVVSITCSVSEDPGEFLFRNAGLAFQLRSARIGPVDIAQSVVVFECEFYVIVQCANTPSDLYLIFMVTPSIDGERKS